MADRDARTRTVTVTVTVVTVTRTRRTTDRCPPPEAQTRSTTLARPTDTHTRPLTSQPSPSPAEITHAATHTNTQPPTQAHLLPAPHIQPHPAAVTQLDPCCSGPITYTNPHPVRNPRQNATPPAPHQQLPPRPLVDTTHSTRARQRAAPEVSVCRAEHARQTRKHRFEGSRNMTNAGFTKRTCPSPWRE